MYQGRSIPKNRHLHFVYFSGLSHRYPDLIKKVKEKKQQIKHHTFKLKTANQEYKDVIDELHKCLLDEAENTEPELSEAEDHANEGMIAAKSQNVNE